MFILPSNQKLARGLHRPVAFSSRAQGKTAHRGAAAAGRTAAQRRPAAFCPGAPRPHPTPRPQPGPRPGKWVWAFSTHRPALHQANLGRRSPSDGAPLFSGEQNPSAVRTQTLRVSFLFLTSAFHAPSAAPSSAWRRWRRPVPDDQPATRAGAAG